MKKIPIKLVLSDDVRYPRITILRLEGKDKEKEKLMVERDNLVTELNLLEKEESLIVN